MKFIIINIINLYKSCFSSLFGPHCRYYPSCSEYTKTAIAKRGLVQGVFAGFIRILSCNPFSKKNYYDPVK